jgi:hypothetical protein
MSWGWVFKKAFDGVAERLSPKLLEDGFDSFCGGLLS